MFTIKKGGVEYLCTVDAILAFNLFSRFCQDPAFDVALYKNGQLITDVNSVKSVTDGK